jgi:Trm5-related predicted tRNA methylase
MQAILLSPDAPDCLETVKKGCVYIIGGIVDRTPQKWKSLFFAREHDLQVILLRYS